MTTDKPDAGEPVEPTLVHRVVLAARSAWNGIDATDGGPAAELWQRVAIAAIGVVQVDERAARERKRGERPADGELSRLCQLGDRAANNRAVFEAGVRFAESGDSDELAKLRAELAEVRAAFGLSPNDIATAAHVRDLCRCLSEFGTRARLAEADRDTEKARADRAEKREAIEREVYQDCAGQLTQAKAQIADLESTCRERLQEMANRDGRVAELEATQAESDKYGNDLLNRVSSRNVTIDSLTKELAAAREELNRSKQVAYKMGHADGSRLTSIGSESVNNQTSESVKLPTSQGPVAPPYETAPTLTKGVTTLERFARNSPHRPGQELLHNIAISCASFIAAIDNDSASVAAYIERRLAPLSGPANTDIRVREALERIARDGRRLDRVVRVESAPADYGPPRVGRPATTEERQAVEDFKAEHQAVINKALSEVPRPGFATAAELADVARKVRKLEDLALAGERVELVRAEIRAEREARKL